MAENSKPENSDAKAQSKTCGTCEHWIDGLWPWHPHPLIKKCALRGNLNGGAVRVHFPWSSDWCDEHSPKGRAAE